ncbi:hypothetical protein [Paenibacillus eucommiae]|uniref:Uncharacterized protein n=1 Tax=Paenibacillus eucommiae TaxID=1355755 RepID=A0ABS4J1F6_9BACL|nr:hypothetical protein [Paenibacillus eucommiae]MBP1993091.1 hypothetical protein [Paenibacillus eucommiae]
MFQLDLDHWSFDKDLQIIHADVRLSISDMIIVEEPLCIDVGLPALLASAFQDHVPDRWAAAEEWSRMPFFVCGCGDPDCRAFSFVIKHLNDRQLEFTWVEERQGSAYKEMESFKLDADLYREKALSLGKEFLQFVAVLDYRPYMNETVRIVKELVQRLEHAKQL